MKHTCSVCGHQDEINPAKLLGAIRTPKKEAAWKRNGENLKKMYAAARTEAVFDKLPSGPWTEAHKKMVANNDMVAVPPKPTTLADKKAAALAALASVGANRPEIALAEVPHAPFDLNLEGEPHRVSLSGNKLALFYTGGAAPTFSRYLKEGELETFWEQRIK